MRTISIRDLHDKTGQWVRRVDEENEIVVTDRGRAVAVLRPLACKENSIYSWKNRPLSSEYQTLLESGRMVSLIDSSAVVAQEREDW
jgi:prevent-host-death family protein